MAGEFGVEQGLFVAVAAMALLLAALVLAGGPARGVNRALSLFLALLGVSYVLDALDNVLESDWLSVNSRLYMQLTYILLPYAYLAFLGLALDTPLVRPLRSRAGRWLLALSGASAAVLFYLGARGARFVREDNGGWQAVGGLPSELALLLAIADRLAALAFFFGLVAGVHALVRAPRGTLARQRATWYVVAFGIQDLGLAFNAAGWLPLPYYFAWGIPLLVSLPLLAYALLRYQLFDFALRLKWTLRQGTVAAAFIAVFFVVSEGAQEIVSESVGPVLGILATGLLVFALAPLQRVAERMSDAAMPRVQPTPAYVQFKKLEVYRAAVESAFEAGHGIDARERQTLDRLRTKLDIASEDARALEDEVGSLFKAARPGAA